MRKLLPLMAGAVLAAGIAACGDSAEKPVTPIPSAASAPAAPPAPKVFVDADAKAALLTLADMPPGWALDTQGKNEELPDNGCPGRWAQSSHASSAHEAAFSKGTLGPFVVHAVTVAEDEKQARESVAKLRTLLAECPSFKDRAGASVKLTEAGYGALGDEIFALRAAIDTGVAPVTADLVVIRKANLLSVIGGLTMSTGASDLPKVVEKAAAKLPR